MGKRKHYSKTSNQLTSKKLKKNYQNDKRKIFSLNDLNQVLSLKDQKITNNFRTLFKSFLKDDSSKGIKCILSFLNVYSQKKVPTIQHIPSIQNLISQVEIIQKNSMNSSDLSMSIKSSKKISQKNSTNDADFLISYFCSVQKLLKKIPVQVSKKQSSLMLKGLWNIVMKYWKQRKTQINLYSGIDSDIEWKLLDFLNFEFKTPMRQRFEAQYSLLTCLQKGQLTQGNEMESIKEVKQQNQQNQEQDQGLCSFKAI